MRSPKKIVCFIGKKVFRAIEHRLFYAIFQVTRVTNDHYGWRPPEEK